jgi:hypothetical protein
MPIMGGWEEVLFTLHVTDSYQQQLTVDHFFLLETL